MMRNGSINQYPNRSLSFNMGGGALVQQQEIRKNGLVSSRYMNDNEQYQ